MRRAKSLAGLALLALVAGCAPAVIEPAGLDTKNDACRSCRMTVSDRRFAAQIVAPGEEPLFFDDIGCLRDYVKTASASVPSDAVAFVADHRTAEWIAAATAVFTENRALATPMASGLVAHRDEASRDQDPAATGGRAVPAESVIGPLARRPR